VREENLLSQLTYVINTQHPDWWQCCGNLGLFMG